MELVVEDAFVDKLSSLTVQQAVGADEAVDLVVSAVADESEGVFRVSFLRPLTFGESIELDVEMVFLHVQTALPAEITQQVCCASECSLCLSLSLVHALCGVSCGLYLFFWTRKLNS
jgi:Ribophorin I